MSRRRSWAYHGYAHIEAAPPDQDNATAMRQLEAIAESVSGVEWAAYNASLGTLVVRFDEKHTNLARIVRVVDRAGAAPKPRGASRLDRVSADRLALGADLLGGLTALAGRAVRLPRLPAELAALPAAADVVPWLRNRIHALAGRTGADLASAIASSAIGAASQHSLRSLSDAALRAIRLNEASGQRMAWASRMRDLHRDAASSRAHPLPGADRPTPLADGPIERYAQRIGLITLLAAGGLMVTPGGRRRAAQALVVGSPGSASIGREAFAARLGRLLASRGVVARDPSALRRLDRVHTVVVDSTVLYTGRLVITSVVPVRGAADAARTRAAELLDGAPSRPGRLGRRVSRGGWSLATASRADPAIARRLAHGATFGRGEVLALTKGATLVAIVGVESELDPLVGALIAAARKAGRVLVAGPASTADRVRADGSVAGGSRLARSVRELQREGAGVALVAGRNDPALAGAECGIGILATGRRPAWGAHLLAGPGLEAAWLVLEAVTLAKKTSGRSTRLATLGSAVGALLALMERTPQAGRRAVTAAGAASVASLASAVWSARALAHRAPPVAEAAIPWHALPVDEVMRLLDASPAGLSDAQAQARQATTASGDTDGDRGLLATAISELDTPLTGPLAAGAGISAATGSATDAILVLSVIVGSALLSARQERVATRAMRRLRTASAVRVRVCRGGAQSLASADEIVTGDVIALEAGDAVPADCRLLTCDRLETDDSALTGESLPVAKNTAETLAASVADRTSMVYAGTTVAAGSATALVVATGRATEAGRSASLMVEEAPTGGVQARLSALAKTSVPLAASSTAAILFGGLLRGRLAESVNSSVALAVAAIPEGLPFVATAAELSASKRLARHNVLVRRPHSIEAAGRVDVICFDKTGTLTEGRIQLRAVSDGRDRRDVGGLGPSHRGIVAAALRASPVPNGNGTFVHPTDHAIVAGAHDAGVQREVEAPRWRAVRELPFEPERGFHAVLGETSSGHIISVKGAPEIVLPRCVAWRPNGRVRALTERGRREIDAEVNRLARQGLRVLAVAERTTSRRGRLDDDRVEDLRLYGLLGLADATRPTAAEAVQRLRRTGVNVVMLTGDHPSTAEAIGSELDLIDTGAVVTGPELEEADEMTVDALVSKAAVFARVSPTHKVTVVQSLRRAGHVVAVTGDGANDAPAIRLADVGIALGDQGTDAARQAADMIVIDGRLETIADGIIAGRAMWASVRDAVALLLGGNLGEIVFAVGSSAISSVPALNARQILFVNLMTDLLPALTVASRAPHGVSLEDLAQEGPESSLGTALTRDVARRAVATSAGSAAGWLAARLTGTPARASTVAVASLVASQLAQTALAARGDPAVLAAVGLSSAALVATVQTPGLCQFFGSRPLGPVAWSIVLGAAIAAVAIAAAPAARLPGLVGAVERALAAQASG